MLAPGNGKTDETTHDYTDTPAQAQESVLQEAQRLTRGIKNVEYGEPLDDWELVAALWTELDRDILAPGAKITAERGLLMMDILKVARERNYPKRDNRVDGPGYWDCLDRTITERARRAKLRA